MLTMSVDRLAELTGGTVVAGSDERVFTGVGIDSRAVAPGMCFFALPGERTDGHAFLPAAESAGARVAVVSRWDEALSSDLGTPSGMSVLLVDDVAAALRALAIHHRGTLRCPVLGITGSTGKTTTKDFIVAALGPDRTVVATKGNRNNELGVPLTVLEADADTEVLVVEMGMRGEGQIASLCGIVRPTMGLITNIGHTHIEVLGTQDAIARAKGELLQCVPPSGRVFLNGDDARSRLLAEDAAAAVTWYGTDEDVDVRASDIEVDGLGRPAFMISANGRGERFALPVAGRHNAYTAAAAAAVALSFGDDLATVADRLRTVRPTGMRLEVFTLETGITVVNDAYNASPTSMRSALETLADMATSGRRIAVLGDMAELGSLSELAHFRIGELLARLSIDVLITVGTRSRRIAEGAVAGGMPPASVQRYDGTDEASDALDAVIRSGDVVLVKASRSMGLERMVERMLDPR